MKAFILAAGMGTRLQPLGLELPKVMVPIGGKPLLQHHIEMLREQGICDLIINLHHLPEKIVERFGDGSRFGVRIVYSPEPELLGTAGAVKRMEKELRGGTFLVLYGDNLVRIELAPLVEFHRERQALLTVALFESPEPWTGGVVETESTGRIVSFVEKPERKQVSTNWISAGIFVLEPPVLDAIPADTFYDFGKDLVPKLLKEGRPLYAMKPKAYLQDIGTPERLAKAQRDFDEGRVHP
jgi:NDP-sugar pyrophosphorylase family protein